MPCLGPKNILELKGKAILRDSSQGSLSRVGDPFIIKIPISERSGQKEIVFMDKIFFLFK